MERPLCYSRGLSDLLFQKNINKGQTIINNKIMKTILWNLIKSSQDETKKAGWYAKDEIRELAERTEKYNNSEISEDDWKLSPGLERNFYEWVKELKII